MRTIRRSTRSVSGTVEYADGMSEPVTAESLLRAPDAALRLLSAAMVLLATALVLALL